MKEKEIRQMIIDVLDRIIMLAEITNKANKVLSVRIDRLEKEIEKLKSDAGTD